MADYRQMDALLHDVEFVDFVSIEMRRRELSELDRRIAALQQAKEALARAPVYRIDRRHYKGAREVCQANGWVDEDVARIVASFRARGASADRGKKSGRTAAVGALASGVRTLGNAISLA